MTPEAIDPLVLACGVPAVFLVSFLSCLAVPLPASLVWPRFLACDVAGEIVWVTIYGGLGYFFSSGAQAVADLAGTAFLLVAAVAATFWLGRILWRRLPGN